MANIFISYARQDFSLAHQFAVDLEKNGWSVWMDTRLTAGDNWDEVIERELQSAQCVLVLWTEASISSRWVKIEASEGDRRNILVPVALADVLPPLPFRFIQYEKLFGWNGDIADPRLTHLYAVIRDKIGINISTGLRHIQMTIIQRGFYYRGTNFNGATRHAAPHRRVSIDYDFAVSTEPISEQDFYNPQGDIQWEEFLKAYDPDKLKNSDLPYHGVSWESARKYCHKLGEITKKNYRLITEAEWEYVVRLGVIDSMPGAFLEWTADDWHDDYTGAPTNGTCWLGGDGEHKVARGASGEMLGNLLFARWKFGKFSERADLVFRIASDFG